MKKGCFVKSIIIITIIIAAIVYIIQYKLDDWVLVPGKKLIISEIAENWDKESEFIYDSTEKDSLSTLIKLYIENIKSMKEVVNLDKDLFLNELKIAIEDSFVTKEELSALATLLKKEQNEKPKSN